MPVTYFVAWWNVENFFDEENAPRTDKLKRAIGKDIQGWTPALRDRKVDQLSSVIAQMNGGLGPDLLGVCEVESRAMLERLCARLGARLNGRVYEVAHADTADERGIDVAFIYDPARFTLPAGQLFQHIVMRRTATREIVQANFTTRHRNRTWAVMGNHWPSRSGGELESAGYRAIAGETLAYFHERVIDVHGPTTPVLAMGDFNDEPFDASLVNFALSTRQRAKVASGTSARLWNLMWPIAGTPDGTFYFDNQPNLLDQFLVNKNMASPNAPLRAVPTSVKIVRFPGMTTPGDYPRPIPFGGMGKPVNENGFADHFPIAMQVTEAD